MADYINREALVDEIENSMDTYWDKESRDYHIPVEDVIDSIWAAPNADVAEVKHGTWSRGKEASGSVYAHCSACGRKMNYFLYGYAHCPMCGARMDGKAQETVDNRRDKMTATKSTKCDTCINSRMCISENGYCAKCTLSQKKAIDCLTGAKSYYTKKPSTKDGENG